MEEKIIEDPIIVQMNIENYRALLRQDLTPERRSAVERMLAEANAAFARATAARTPR